MSFKRPLVRLGRGLLIAGAGVLGLLIVAALLLQTRWAGQRLAGFLEERVSARIAGRVTIASLDIDGSSFALAQLRVYDPAGALVGQIDRLVVDFALLPLVRRELLVERLTVNGPLARFVPATPDQGLIAALKPTEPQVEEPPLRWSMRLERLLLTSGVLEVSAGPVLPERERAAVRVAEIRASGDGHYAPQRRDVAFALDLRGRTVGLATGELEVTARGSGQSGLDHGDARLRLGDLALVRARIIDSDTLAIALERAQIPPALAAVALPGWPLERAVALRGTGRLGPNAARIDVRAEVVGTAAWASLEGSIGYDLARSPDGMTLQLEGLSPAQVFARGPDTSVSLTAEVGPGSLRPEQISARLEMNAPAARWRRGRWGPLALVARVDDGQLEQLDGRLVLPGGRLMIERGEGNSVEAPGAQRRAPVWVAGRLQVTSLRRAAAALANLTGAERPAVKGHGWLRFAVLGDPLRGLAATGLELRGRFASLTFGERTGQRLRVRATLPPAGEGRRRFHAHARLGVPPALEVLIAGHRVAQTRDDQVLGLQLERVRLGYRALAQWQRWTMAGDALVRLGVDTASIADLALVSTGQRVSVNLERDAQRLTGDVSLTRVRLASLPRALAGTATAGSGVVNGWVRVRGTAASPRVAAQLTLHDGRWRQWRNLDATIAAVYRQARVEGKLQLSAPELQLDSRFDIPADWPPPTGAVLDIGAQVRRLDLAKLHPWLTPSRAATVRGALVADVQVSGTTSAPRMSARARVEDLAVRVRPGQGGEPVVPFSGAGRLELRYRDQVLAAHVGLHERDGGILRAEVTMFANLSPLRLAGAASGRALTERPIQGSLQLKNFESGWLAALLPPVKLMRGRMLAELQLQGTLAAPELNGRIGLRQGRMVVVPRRRP